MSKCLVTRLQESVNDESLLKLGELRFTTKGVDPGDKHLLIGTTDEQTLSVIGEGTLEEYTADGTLFPGGVSVTIEANKQRRITPSQEGMEFSMSNKYAIRRICDESSIIDVFDISQLEYATSIYQLLCESMVGDTKYLRNLTNLQSFGTISSLSSLKNISGSLSDFSNCVSLETLSIGYSKIGGDIMSLGNLTRITSLFATYTQIQGAVENLISTQSLNGRVVGTFTFAGYGTRLTLNSNSLSGTYKATFNESGCVITKNESVIAAYTKSSNTWAYS